MFYTIFCQNAPKSSLLLENALKNAPGPHQNRALRALYCVLWFLVVILYPLAQIRCFEPYSASEGHMRFSELSARSASGIRIEKKTSTSALVFSFWVVMSLRYQKRLRTPILATLRRVSTVGSHSIPPSHKRAVWCLSVALSGICVSETFNCILPSCDCCESRSFSY